MKVLIIGSGKGSWIMRGQQLGAAIGARVTSSPSDADWQWADRVVLIKRAGPAYATEARKRGLPIVWDALDFWKQPAENRLSEAEAKRLLDGMLRTIKPTLTIGATQAMTNAIRACGYVAEYLPHHSWQGLAPTEPREAVKIVAYEGNPVYLGSWLAVLQNECAKRGWTFVVNPKSLREADILVAFRDGIWDGWMPREWKSGVKFVNAIAAGKPLLFTPCAAATELQPEGRVITHRESLPSVLDILSSGQERRFAARQRCPYTLDLIATAYRGILAGVEMPCSA